MSISSNRPRRGDPLGDGASESHLNNPQETLLLCRFCGHLNRPSETGARCAQCGAFSGMEAVAAGEAERRSRRLRLEFLRNRLVRAVLVVLPLLGLLMYVLWTYTGLPPDPPQPSTAIGDTSAPPVPGDWRQAGGGAANLSAAVGSSPSLNEAPSASGGWEYSAGAPIVAPPAVAGDRVFVTAEDGSVAALDRDTGAVIWRYDSGLTAAVTPAVSDGLVFVVFKPGIVSALDENSGDVVWSKRLPVASLPSPTVVDGRLFVAETDRNRLLALDAATGETLWDHRLGDWVIAPPAVHDGLLIATSNDARIHVLNVDTGKLRMIYNAGEGRWIRGGPVVTDDLLHVSSNGVRRDGNRARVWGIDYRGHRYPLERPIYYVRTQLAVWGFAKQPPIQQGTVWSTRTAAKQPYQPAVSDRTIVVSDAAGLVTALDAGSGEILWETDLAVDITTAATIAGSIALVGDEHGRITALSLADGAAQWVVTLNGAVAAPPVVAGDLLLAPSTGSGGTLTALRTTGQ